MYRADVEQYLSSINSNRTYVKRLKTLIPILSIIIILIVFWSLKLTGITLAGEAFCGFEEHKHTEECYGGTSECQIEEHIHTSDCYSDISADLETSEIWEETLIGIPAGMSKQETLVAVAKTQLGYTESELNFKVDENGEKHGYTRYGEWYGNPYGKWSTMFTSFCLHYAEIDGTPTSAGAESMQLEWQEDELYEPADGYVPSIGNIAFIDKDNNDKIDTTAIVTNVSGASIDVIEGDLDNKVAENSYELNDKSIKGYGLIPEDVSANISKGQTFAMARAATGKNFVGTTTEYSANQVNGKGQYVIYTQGSDGNYYAIDGNANAVRVYVDVDGNITTDSADIDSLLWTFTSATSYDNQSTHYIQNVATSQYIHPYHDNDRSHGAILSGRWETAAYINGEGIKFRGARQNYYAVLQNYSSFTDTNSRDGASTFYLGKAASSVAIWLDGTNGGLNHGGESPNQKYTVREGDSFILPTEWQSPTKYAYKLNGWYDVTNSKYYNPGDTVKVLGNMVFYADWIAATYDVGQYNQYVADTISTNDFITTKMFDYNYLFNVMSQKATVSFTDSGHSEDWNFVANGTVPYNNAETLDFVFTDYTSEGKLSYARNRNDNNSYLGSNGQIVPGIYTERIGNALFSTENLIGKTYLGTGDHLFQIDTDPTSEHYGYYYYDCALNAASYNQTDQRFYVYEYLERTVDSSNNSQGKYSDILPYNSPYANNNDQDIVTYTYSGDNNEYQGVNHCQYDVNNSSNGRVQANLAFGMSMEIEFYLPNAPGERDAEGDYGNKDIYGNDMHFKFSGDDDLWVLMDGEVILDIGGIHQVESGDINFSTGEVRVNGAVHSNIKHIEPGEHTLTVLYLERGSSMSNCAIYFNLAPRFALELQKEDVLTQELLDGAQFSVFTDKECTEPAELWASEEEHDSGKPSTNTFTIKDGITNLWGFGAGNTYYIKETRAPNVSGYGLVKGIIRITFDKTGTASHSIEVIKEVDDDGNEIPITNGYTFHGFRIDEENLKAYVIITNAQEWVTETTTAQVLKVWNDKLDHKYDSVAAYLTITDPDGTVRRIREIQLSEENDWTYTWTNLPKYYQDGVTEIIYGVEEAYKQGYSPTIEKIDEITVIDHVWAESLSFENGKPYILKTANGYLSTVSESDSKLCWVDEAKAKDSVNALWTATVSSGKVKLTNGSGYVLTFNYNNSSTNRYYTATKSNMNYQSLTAKESGGGIKLYATRNNRNYYIGNIDSNGRASASTSERDGIVLAPMIRITEERVQELEDYAYKITNTPLEEETSLKVFKEWDVGMATDADYQRAQVTVKLIANGKDTGRTVTLSLKNNWNEIFQGLPYKDDEGNLIKYTVEESWDNEDWMPSYGEVITVDGEIPTYEVTVTNSYRWGHGYELPSTGGPGTIILLLCGLAIMAGALVCGCILRRKRERGYG